LLNAARSAPKVCSGSQPAHVQEELNHSRSKNVPKWLAGSCRWRSNETRLPRHLPNSTERPRMPIASSRTAIAFPLEPMAETRQCICCRRCCGVCGCEYGSKYREGPRVRTFPFRPRSSAAQPPHQNPSTRPRANHLLNTTISFI
jgi:hypothetical protein